MGNCGQMKGYNSGCRCEECTEANRVYMRAYRERQRKDFDKAVINFESIDEGDTSWVEFAACQKEDTETFFPQRGDWKMVQKALDICKTCTVVDDCLAYALRTDQTIGVWGGKSGRERRAMSVLMRETA